jgi:hypothetical protein
MVAAEFVPVVLSLFSGGQPFPEQFILIMWSSDAIVLMNLAHVSRHFMMYRLWVYGWKIVSLRMLVTDTLDVRSFAFC